MWAQVISHNFSDIVGMNSPGDQLLAASPQPALAQASRLNPNAPSSSPMASPQHAVSPSTPDSFGRNPAVPYSPFEAGSALGPQPARNTRRQGLCPDRSQGTSHI